MPLSRAEAFLDELPKNNYVITTSAKKAGYSEHTANTQQKRIMKNALKYQAKKVMQAIKNDDITSAQAKIMMSEIVGISRETLMERLKTIATQNKDLGSALKVLAPLVKEYGVVLSADEAPKTVVPILNVTVSKPEELPEVIENGSVEPVNIDSQG